MCCETPHCEAIDLSCIRSECNSEDIFLDDVRGFCGEKVLFKNAFVSTLLSSPETDVVAMTVP